MNGTELILTEWLMVLVFVTGVVTWGFLMSRNASVSLENTFLAGRKVPGFVASLSTVATNLNANDFIGGAGFAYGVGVVYLHGGWANGLALMLVAILVIPKLRRLDVFTLGGWLEKRYSATIGNAYSIIWACVWMLFNLGLYLYAGALVLHTLVGWDLYVSIVLLSIIAAVYTLIGGFGAVVATDVLQVALMFFPFIFLASAVWIDFGGLGHLTELLPAEKASFWTNETPFGSLVVMLLGIFIMGLSYWSCEAQIIQRPLSTPNVEDATTSYIGATFWMSLFMPLLVTIPALAAIHYFPDLENNDLAMPSLIRKFLPRGLYGVTVVGLIAGVFSSADSQINAFSTMFTTDIYKRLIRPGQTDRHYLSISRISGIIFTLLAIVTAMLFTTDWAKDGMMLFAIGVLATIMPPFAAITILGATIGFVNHRGALIGLVVGGFVAIGLVFVSQYGYLDAFADDTLFIRASLTFLVSAALTLMVSWRLPIVVDSDQQAHVDTSLAISGRTWAMCAVLVTGMIALMSVWTYYF